MDLADWVERAFERADGGGYCSVVLPYCMVTSGPSGFTVNTQLSLPDTAFMKEMVDAFVDPFRPDSCQVFSHDDGSSLDLGLASLLGENERVVLRLKNDIVSDALFYFNWADPKMTVPFERLQHVMLPAAWEIVKPSDWSKYAQHPYYFSLPPRMRLRDYVAERIGDVIAVSFPASSLHYTGVFEDASNVRYTLRVHQVGVALDYVAAIRSAIAGAEVGRNSASDVDIDLPSDSNEDLPVRV